MVANTLSLFSGLKEFEQLEKIVQLREARKRGKYNKKIQIDNKWQFLLILSNLINPYTYITAIYNHLAVNYVQMPLFSKEEAAFYYKGLNVYYSVYQPEDYTYYDYPTQGLEGNNETVSGEDFQVFEAELAETENFNINDRLTLHIRLLDLLEQGVQLEQATSQLQPEIERIKQIYDKEKVARERSDIFKRV